MKSAKVLVMLVLAAALAHGCQLPTAPLPDGAVSYAPNPQSVSTWWQQVEECSGLRGDLSRVLFFLVPDAATFRWEGRDVIGLWMERDNRIVLAGDFAFRDQNVRHEMLHALTRMSGHPREYFVDKCGAIVDQSR
jgi:hypothetical protein